MKYKQEKQRITSQKVFFGNKFIDNRNDKLTLNVFICCIVYIKNK